MATFIQTTFLINHRSVLFTDGFHILSFLPCSLGLQHSLVSYLELLIRSWSFFGGSTCQQCPCGGMTEVKRLTNFAFACLISDQGNIKNACISLIYDHRLIHCFRIEVKWIINGRWALMGFAITSRNRCNGRFSVDQGLGLFSVHTYSIVCFTAWC